MIECVNIASNHLFDGNPIAAQHRLRFRSIIERQDWDVPFVDQMEYDTYDNPAAVYLIWRDALGEARGVSRLYPTDRPYMLKEAFPFLSTHTELPSDAKIWEGSRFCIDKTLSPEERKRIMRELILGYLEFGLEKGVDQFIGVMLPAYWKHIFIDVGWHPEWFGEVVRLPNGDRVRAGGVKVSPKALKQVREASGIHHNVLLWENKSTQKKAA